MVQSLDGFRIWVLWEMVDLWQVWSSWRKQVTGTMSLGDVSCPTPVLYSLVHFLPVPLCLEWFPLDILLPSVTDIPFWNLVPELAKIILSSWLCSTALWAEAPPPSYQSSCHYLQESWEVRHVGPIRVERRIFRDLRVQSLPPEPLLNVCKSIQLSAVLGHPRVHRM